MTQNEWNELTVQKITNIENFINGQVTINENFVRDITALHNILKDFTPTVPELAKNLTEQNKQLRKIVESLAYEITILKKQVNELTNTKQG
jgi:hypothetical protein